MRRWAVQMWGGGPRRRLYGNSYTPRNSAPGSIESHDAANAKLKFICLFWLMPVGGLLCCWYLTDGRRPLVPADDLMWRSASHISLSRRCDPEGVQTPARISCGRWVALVSSSFLFFLGQQFHDRWVRRSSCGRQQKDI